jgi:hypothetical protein
MTLTLAGLSFSARAVQCEYKQEISGKMVASRFYTLSLGCVVVVTPQNKPDLIYREYYFDERGRFMIFDSQPGEYETSTATQSYFLFPRRQEPDFQLLTDGSFQVTMSSGRQIVISAQEPKIVDFPGATFSEPSDFGLKPQDFLSIQSYPDLLMDSGSVVGGTAYGLGHSQNLSTFRDSAGNSCAIKNAELFDYTHILYSEPTFLFDTEQKLTDFLTKRCPQLRAQEPML